MIVLPIDSFLPQIVDTIRASPSLVLVAPPGAGKTTRVPPALIAAKVLPGDQPNLIMLQPRRVAARAAAQRIAEERGWQLGGEVGYHIRFEKRYGKGTRIRIFTEAILTRMLLGDPYLDGGGGGGGIGCVILDEFHERNLHTDLTLAFLREIQGTVRPDLKIIVMSATLDAEPVAKYLGGAPVIVTEGRTFPVETSYHPLRDVPLETQIARVADVALQQDGDVLVFLPGMAEIERTRRALGALEREGCVLLPLHGSLPPEEQQRALRPDPAHRRKFILATNIAETSLTIDGVRTVIDSGFARVASFDPDRGMDRLDLERISKASATQRAGRAGRQGPGRALRLWSEQEHKHLAEFDTPEVQRVDLAGTVLAVHAWGAADVRAFGWFDRPPEEMLAAAEELLALLGALKGGALTDLGRRMMSVPAHPRIARLLLAAAETALQDEALSLAAILSDDSRAPGSADPLALLHRLPPQVQRLREQFASTLRHAAPAGHESVRPNAVEDLLLLAYPDRIGRRRSGRGADPFAAVLADGSGLRLSKEALTPAIVAAPLFLALDARHDPRNRRAEAMVRTATPLEESTLSRLFPGQLRTTTALEYDQEKQKVIAFTRRLFNDLLLSEDPHGKVDPATAGPILAAALAPRARELFERDEQAAKLLARVGVLRHAMPEQAWPAFDDAQLQALLAEACAHKRSLAELVESRGLGDAVRSALAYPLDRQLDQFAPETIEVPSGSRIRLDYLLPASPAAPPPPPVLAVRLQELFGLLDTPRIAGGRVPVLLHLLSPGYKPMQITSDLRSFWSSAYFEVRKDLRTRYPRHKWPEDPLTEAPEAKGRPRRT
jgi:ATP-dependent helicase HrpB